MIDHLKGRLRGRGKDHAVLECGGIGFRVTLTAGAMAGLPSEGEELTLRTWLQVREGGADLFGFASAAERDIFAVLLSVSGVGPRSALAVLSALGDEGVLSAAARGDAAPFTRAPGIGKKLAQRMASELPDALRKAEILLVATAPSPEGTAGTAQSVGAEAVEALVALGFSRFEVQATVSRLSRDGVSEVGELVRRSLPLLSGAGR
jgi:Holliday junction DNA helicase RuvA